jgi:hypothetical protein
MAFLSLRIEIDNPAAAGFHRCDTAPGSSDICAHCNSVNNPADCAPVRLQSRGTSDPAAPAYQLLYKRMWHRHPVLVYALIEPYTGELVCRHAQDLENKLREYQCYYNEHRCHAGRDGATPVDSGVENIATLNDYRWKKHCRGLFQLPVAA